MIYVHELLILLMCFIGICWKGVPLMWFGTLNAGTENKRPVHNDPSHNYKEWFVLINVSYCKDI